MWVDIADWREAWEVLESLAGGGQGAGFRVRSRTTPAQIAFVKVLNRQDDMERRTRFFREATAYAECAHHGLPRLIQTNAHHYARIESKLYIATEFVPGPTLSKIVERVGSRSLEQALGTALTLLDTVEYYHGRDWVHRDIKPDNIILRNECAEDPVLVDFGLSFSANNNSVCLTEDGQELGNRFLRLPELSVSSPVKHDARSDLTFVGGIFFYLLTGQTPATLLDTEGRMPHQREKVLIALRTAHHERLLPLLSFFDRFFGYRLADRYASAAEMRAALLRIRYYESQMNDDSDSLLDKIVSSLNTAANRRLIELRDVYNAGMQAIQQVHGEILVKVQPTYGYYQSGYDDFPEGKRNILGFGRLATDSVKFAPLFEIRLVGDEIVVQVNGELIYRTDAADPKFDEPFKKKIKAIYVQGLQDLTRTQV